MSTEKEVLRKLAKVVQNQQKIIHKLAQSTEQDITEEVNMIIKKTPNLPAGTACAGATFLATSQIVTAQIKLMSGKPGDPINQQVIKLLSAAIAAEKQIPLANVKIILLFG
jgi:hypothetical protein